ncbi:MAG: hypothetical protein AMXMBFR84_42720 [Candidatus Hydrogenedentota bacterium]
MNTPKAARILFLVLVWMSQGASAEEGFISIFDGRTLNGWQPGDASYWTVEDGAITGRITQEHPCTVNQYLVWEGGELADFELKLESRLTGEGGINNGFQFRSRLLPDHDICGYQVDNNLETPWLVRLYDEYGRHTLAMRGEHADFDLRGNRTATPLADAVGDPWFSLENWHEYHLTCIGGSITLRVDGRLAASISDTDARRAEPQGIFALQLHSGPPTLVQFRNIRVKVLKPAEPVEVPDSSGIRKALVESAMAWWPLDEGGHGAKVPLRHTPAFDQIQLNVRAAGPGAKPGAKVVLLDGAYFDAGPDLHADGSAITAYLRARDPSGTWNAALFAKRGSHDQVHFNLFSTDLDGDGTGNIGFEVCTDRGFTMVSFPASRIASDAWLDLVGRYDGQTLSLYCNGEMMASSPWTGNLIKNAEPVLIAAETDQGAVVRHFHGELEEAALWSRALTETEIQMLSHE